MTYKMREVKRPVNSFPKSMLTKKNRVGIQVEPRCKMLTSSPINIPRRCHNYHLLPRLVTTIPDVNPPKNEAHAIISPSLQRWPFRPLWASFHPYDLSDPSMTSPLIVLPGIRLRFSITIQLMETINHASSFHIPSVKRPLRSYKFAYPIGNGKRADSRIQAHPRL